MGWVLERLELGELEDGDLDRDERGSRFGSTASAP